MSTKTKEFRRTIVTIVVCVLPIIGLLIGFAVCSHALSSLGDHYARHRKFWGGNPSEVFSHWLDMVLLSGNAAAIAWLVSMEAVLRRTQAQVHWWRGFVQFCAIFTLILSGAVGAVLDSKQGEGTVLIADLIFFIPILAACHYLLRQFAALVNWKPVAVMLICLAFAISQTFAQLHFEPSETGGPSFKILPFWLGSIGLAIVWALVRGTRTYAIGRNDAKPGL